MCNLFPYSACHFPCIPGASIMCSLPICFHNACHKLHLSVRLQFLIKFICNMQAASLWRQTLVTTWLAFIVLFVPFPICLMHCFLTGSQRRYGFKDSCGSRAIFVWKYDPLISIWAKMAWILRCSRLPQYGYKWHGFYRCLLSLRTFSWMKTPRLWLSIKTIFRSSRDSHYYYIYGDGMVMRLSLSYLYNGKQYTGMTASLYWDRPMNLGRIPLENSSL